MLRTNRNRLILPIALAVLAVGLMAPAAQARPRVIRTPQGTETIRTGKDGVRHLSFRWGPVKIAPGQNTIAISDEDLKPPGPGWITSFAPNLTYVNGRVPRVDIIHLHHAVWLINGRPTWAAGEEKTRSRMPKGFGWRYRPGDRWALNHMIHNLTPNPTRVYVTWEMDFVPAAPPAAQHARRSRRSGWTSRAARPTRCSTRSQGAGPTAATRSPTQPEPVPGGRRRATSGSSRTTARSSGPPATCTRAGCTPT